MDYGCVIMFCEVGQCLSPVCFGVVIEVLIPARAPFSGVRGVTSYFPTVTEMGRDILGFLTFHNL